MTKPRLKRKKKYEFLELYKSIKKKHGPVIDVLLPSLRAFAAEDMLEKKRIKL